jgi:ketosteroid isomerase-like protein
MHRLAYLVALVALAGCARSANVAQEQDALMAKDREWSGVAKDVDKFVSYFATDATVHAPGMPAVTGPDAIRKTYGEMAGAPGFALSFAPSRAVVAASGDIGYTAGTYEMSMAGGAEKGKYVTTWKKENGEWKVAEDIFNADSAPATAAGSHVMVPPADLKWGDPPPSLPAGAKLAVVTGDPSQPQPFVIRLQAPAGYKIAPHWHPGVENVTVLSGTGALGMGEQFNEASMTQLGPGGYASLPAEMRHYFMAKTGVTIQVHGMGPFVVNYVNPADDPSKQQK